MFVNGFKQATPENFELKTSFLGDVGLSRKLGSIASEIENVSPNFVVRCRPFGEIESHSSYEENGSKRRPENGAPHLRRPALPPPLPFPVFSSSSLAILFGQKFTMMTKCLLSVVKSALVCLLYFTES